MFFLSLSFQSHPSDYELDLLLRRIHLEVSARRGRAAVASLAKNLSSAEKDLTTKTTETELERKTLQRKVEEETRRIVALVATVESLLGENNVFFDERLRPIVQSIGTILEEELLPMKEPMSELMVTGLRDKPGRQINSFLSVRSLEAFRTTRIPQQQQGKNEFLRHQTRSLSIYRLLTPVEKDPPESALRLQSTLLLQQLGRGCCLPQSSVMALLEGVLRDKARREALRRWLKGGGGVKEKMGERLAERVAVKAGSLKKLCQTLSEFDRCQVDNILPRAKEDLANLESANRNVKKVSHAMDIWRDEPAQQTISTDVHFAVKDHTLKKWQETFRVALAKWQQMAKVEQQAKK